MSDQRTLFHVEMSLTAEEAAAAVTLDPPPDPDCSVEWGQALVKAHDCREAIIANKISIMGRVLLDNSRSRQMISENPQGFIIRLQLEKTVNA